jgi:hypothetical protein
MMRLRFPLFRLGLLVVVGAVFVSVVSFYIGVGTQLADLSGEDLATEPRALVDHFVANFLFAGSTAGVVFWAGIGLCVLGIGRMVLFPRGRKRR